ncbi:MAG TPA: hypothetical protein VLA99_06320 [Nitrospiraceae bacterium]|nr:hypothetical protein [Nitrospiraceae bacterium]
MALGRMASVLLLTVAIIGQSQHARSADGKGEADSPSAPGGQGRSPQQPGLMPPLPPPEIDPGIQQYPETIPNPESVVPPPQVDPDMAINPATRERLKDSPVPQPTPNPGPSDPVPPDPVPAPPTPVPPGTPRH